MADELRARLAIACRILSLDGHEHFHLGHVSARHARSPDRFWIKPATIGLGEVRASDLVLVDLEGNRVEGDAPLHQEVPIHVEIYRRRPDVRAIVHTHPLHASALAASAAEFRLVGQDSVPFAPRPACYDSPQLVVTSEQGQALADALGLGPAVLLRNHGIVVVDETIEGAVYLATALERSVRIQHAAAVLGGIREIEPAEAEELQRELARSHQTRSRTAFDYRLRTMATTPDA